MKTHEKSSFGLSHRIKGFPCSSISAISVLLFLILLGSGVVSAASEPSKAPPTKPFPPGWQAALDQATLHHPGGFQMVPGTSMVIHSPTWGTRVGISGYDNIETHTTPAPDKPYRIGSMTKMFTTMVILKMEQEGILRLTDTVGQYLPPGMTLANSDKITIAECLQMTSGIKEYVDAPLFNSYPYDSRSPCPCGNKTFSPVDIMDIINQGNTPPEFAPGAKVANPFSVVTDFYVSGGDPNKVPTYNQVTADPPLLYQPAFPSWAYSSSGYIVLGIIVENLLGQPMREVIKKQITEPLGMSQTYLSDSSDIPVNMMRGYSKHQASGLPYIPPQLTWIDRTVFNPSYAWTAGAVISTQWDMLIFLKSIFSGDVIINEATRQKYLTFVSAGWMGLGNVNYGVGACMEDPEAFGTLRGHGGILLGFRSLGYYLPDSDTYFLIMVNTSDQYPPTPKNPTGIWPEIWIMDQVMPLVYGGPTTPKPINNSQVAVGSDGSLTLKAQAGRVYGDSYVFYMGTDPNQLTAVGTSIKVPRCQVKVAPKTTYYWRADAVTAGVTYESPVWSFTTN